MSKGNCPGCGKACTKKYDVFRAIIDGVEVVVPDVYIYECKDCDYSVLPYSEEQRIDYEIEKLGLESERQRSAKFRAKRLAEDPNGS